MYASYSQTSLTLSLSLKTALFFCGWVNGLVVGTAIIKILSTKKNWLVEARIQLTSIKGS